jgi:hypothetical protein
MKKSLMMEGRGGDAFKGFPQEVMRDLVESGVPLFESPTGIVGLNIDSGLSKYIGSAHFSPKGFSGSGNIFL